MVKFCYSLEHLLLEMQVWAGGGSRLSPGLEELPEWEGFMLESKCEDRSEASPE